MSARPRLGVLLLLGAAAAACGDNAIGGGARLVGPTSGPARTDAAAPTDATSGADHAGPTDDAALGSRPDAGATPAPDAATASPCAAVQCPDNARCVPPAATCSCLPGFVDRGGACTPSIPGSPAQHTREAVCQAWTEGHVENAPRGGFSVSEAMCDPGELSREGLDDALRRLNMFRWLAGVPPTTDSPAAHRIAQACALVSAWNPAGQQAHQPPPTSQCYTPEGAQGAGSSNIAWGNGTAANAMDQWIVDNGNESTYGHRRWLLSAPLSDVGIGAYQGGNNYGSAACITVFAAGGQGEAPPVIVFPPPGFVPAAMADWAWTLQGRVPQTGLGVTVREASTGNLLATRIEALVGNYGGTSGLSLVREGWQTRPDETYEVEVRGDGVPPITYTLTPVSCP